MRCGSSADGNQQDLRTRWSAQGRALPRESHLMVGALVHHLHVCPLVGGRAVLPAPANAAGVRARSDLTIVCACEGSAGAVLGLRRACGGRAHWVAGARARLRGWSRGRPWLSPARAPLAGTQIG